MLKINNSVEFNPNVYEKREYIPVIDHYGKQTTVQVATLIHDQNGRKEASSYIDHEDVYVSIVQDIDKLPSADTDLSVIYDKLIDTVIIEHVNEADAQIDMTTALAYVAYGQMLANETAKHIAKYQSLRNRDVSKPAMGPKT